MVTTGQPDNNSQWNELKGAKIYYTSCVKPICFSVAGTVISDLQISVAQQQVGWSNSAKLARS